MIFEIPLLGDLMKVINHPAGFLVLIIIPLSICLFGEIKNLVKVIKEEKAEEKKDEENIESN